MQAATLARPSRAVLAVVLVAAGLAACGGDSSSTDEDEVKKTVNGVYDALAAQDAGKVCDSLSEAGKRQLTSGARSSQRDARCEQFLSAALKSIGDAVGGIRAAKVTSVDLDGDKAIATVAFRKQSSKVGLVKEDGTWKLNDLTVR